MERKIHLPSKTGIASQNPTASGHKTAQQGVSGGSSLKTLYQAVHTVTDSMTDHYLMRKAAIQQAVFQQSNISCAVFGEKDEHLKKKLHAGYVLICLYIQINIFIELLDCS